MHSEFFEYQWKYLISSLAGRFGKSLSGNKQILFVTHTSTIGWILDAKARRLSRYFPGKSSVFYTDNFWSLPDADGYFFLHQKYFARAIRYNPHIRKRKNVVMFTHPEWSKRYSARHIAFVLKYADWVICLNQAMANTLVDLGLDRNKIAVFHMASDPVMFQPKERFGDGAIGFCMGFYRRKNPELIIDLVKSLPGKHFILIGRHWKKYERFKEIENLSNFDYYEEVAYDKYPELYHKMDVFISPSHLEGGPVPLLEAMLCNVVPVVTRTGFGPDLITHGENGFLFDSTDSVQDVIPLIHQAYNLKTNIRDSALSHSWQNYGIRIGKLFDASYCNV